ncbi:site-specific DNA-methyltransferase, partial [Gammaproteobacteria bacterium]|nr:site-specific DNA-methyltransferase [Gammaproteobacteria bacterium]
GTTGVVCARNNRNYIGIDSDKSYCELSRKRIKSIQSKKL